MLRVAGAALSALRKVKSDAKVSQRTPFVSATLTFPAGTQALAEKSLEDLVAANHVEGSLKFIEGPVDSALVSESELGEAPAKQAK